MYRCFEMYIHCLPGAHKAYRLSIVRKGQIFIFRCNNILWFVSLKHLTRLMGGIYGQVQHG